MQDSRWERWAPWAGVAFALLVVVGGALLMGDLPDPEDPDTKIRAYYASTAAHFRALSGAVLCMLSMVFFLWFLVHLETLISRAEGERSYAGRFAFLGGLLFAVFFLAGGAAIAAVAGAIEVGGGTSNLDPDWMRIMPQLGFGLLRIIAGPMAAVMMFTTSVVTLRTGILPRATAWSGFVLGIIEMIIITPVPMVAIPIWVLIISVALMRMTKRQDLIAPDSPAIPALEQA